MFPASIFCLGLAISSFLSITVPLTVARSVAADDWTLVFEDDFEDRNDALADWTCFGGTSSKSTGRKGRGLLIETEGGLAEPAYAGAVHPLGGGIKPNDIVTANAVWRIMSRPPSDATSCSSSSSRIVKGHEGRRSVDPRRDQRSPEGKWETTTLDARVPASASSADLALVLVPAREKGTLASPGRRGLRDPRSPPARSPRRAPGTFESSDGGADRLDRLQQRTRRRPRRDERAFKSWGPFGEPYSGSIMQQVVQLDKIRPGHRSGSRSMP